MKKEHKEKLFPIIEQQISRIVPDVRYIELGPEWDYYIFSQYTVVQNDVKTIEEKIDLLGKFQLLYTNGICKSFCTYSTKDDEPKLLEIEVCQLTAAIDEVADLAEAHYRDDVDADIVFVPYGGYWFRIQEKNEFWPLIPNVEIKAYNYEEFRNKIAEISVNNNI